MAFCVYARLRNSAPFVEAEIIHAMSKIVDICASLQPQLIAWRRTFHAIPEPSGSERETSNRIAEICDSLGFKTTLHEDINAVIADTGHSEPVVALRADIDALPGHEESGVSFASKGDFAHLCGHDMHIAMALGAGLASKMLDDSLSIRLIFQPHEEKPPGGASALINRGILRGITSVFGLHVDPQSDVGQIQTRAGAFFAGADNFEISIRGKGGHAAAPHKLNDTVYTASSIVVASQAVVSRFNNPVDPLVVTFSTINGGCNCNVTPDIVELKGTLRSYSEVVQKRAFDDLKRVCENIGAICGSDVEMKPQYGYPPLVNTRKGVDTLARASRILFGEGYLNCDAGPYMFGEDFGYYLKQTEGAFAFIGAGIEGKRYPLHNSAVVFDEDVLWRGASLLLACAIHEMEIEL